MSGEADHVTGPSDEELVTSWGVLMESLLRTQDRILHSVEAEGGVPAQWFTVLHILLTADGHRLPMGRLAAELSMTGGGFTKLADRIAREGLIDRRNSVGDRRVVYAELTEAGLQLAKRGEAVYREQLRIHVLGASLRGRDLPARGGRSGARQGPPSRKRRGPRGDRPIRAPAAPAGSAPRQRAAADFGRGLATV